jgi:hypothetical protein
MDSLQTTIVLTYYLFQFLLQSSDQSLFLIHPKLLIYLIFDEAQGTMSKKLIIQTLSIDKFLYLSY